MSQRPERNADNRFEQSFDPASHSKEKIKERHERYDIKEDKPDHNADTGHGPEETRSRSQRRAKMLFKQSGKPAGYARPGRDTQVSDSGFYNALSDLGKLCQGMNICISANIKQTMCTQNSINGINDYISGQARMARKGICPEPLSVPELINMIQCFSYYFIALVKIFDLPSIGQIGFKAFAVRCFLILLIVLLPGPFHDSGIQLSARHIHNGGHQSAIDLGNAVIPDTGAAPAPLLYFFFILFPGFRAFLGLNGLLNSLTHPFFQFFLNLYFKIGLRQRCVRIFPYLRMRITLHISYREGLHILNIVDPKIPDKLIIKLLYFPGTGFPDIRCLQDQFAARGKDISLKSCI